MLNRFFNTVIWRGQIQMGVEFFKVASEFLSKSVNRV